MENESSPALGAASPESPESLRDEGSNQKSSLDWKGAAWIVLELSAVVLLVGVVFGQRFLELEKIEIGGDALKVWEFARNLVMGGEFPAKLNHHTSRFGLVLPSMLAQWAVGVQATSYYVAPLAASVLLHLWVYLIGRRLSGPLAGVIGVGLLLSFAPMVRASSQILPEAFGPMYTTFAMYMALLYGDAQRRWTRWLALCLAGIGLVFAYGSKMIYLYYAPGLAFLVWFGGAQGSLLPSHWTPKNAPETDSSWRARFWYRLRTSKLAVPAVLTGLVLLLLLVETFVVSSVSDSSTRFSVVQGSHGGGGAKGPRIQAVSDFFALYTRAPTDWMYAFAGGSFAWLGLMAFARDRRARLIGLALLIYVLLQTFVVRRLDPLTPWTKPHPRYLLAMAGPLAIVAGIFAGDAIDALTWANKDRRPRSLRRFFSLAAVIALLVTSSSHVKKRWESEFGKKTAWHKTQKTAEQLTAAYTAGLPIIAETPRGKPAWAAGAVFINPTTLLDEEGAPIASADLMRKYPPRGRFLARGLHTIKAKKKYIQNAVMARGRKRKCVIMLRQSVRFISGNLAFKAKCESLEEEFKKNPKAGHKRPPKPRSRDRRTKRARTPSKAKAKPTVQKKNGPKPSKPEPVEKSETR